MDYINEEHEWFLKEWEPVFPNPIEQGIVEQIWNLANVTRNLQSASTWVKVWSDTSWYLMVFVYNLMTSHPDWIGTKQNELSKTCLEYQELWKTLETYLSEQQTLVQKVGWQVFGEPSLITFSAYVEGKALAIVKKVREYDVMVRYNYGFEYVQDYDSSSSSYAMDNIISAIMPVMINVMVLTMVIKMMSTEMKEALDVNNRDKQHANSAKK